MKKVGILGAMGAALSAALLAGGTQMVSPAPTAQRQRRLAPNVARSYWYSGRRDHKAGKKAGQTDAQAAQALERAQAKRTRKAAALTRWAERSAEGAQAWHLALTGGATY
jgi:hypothetical protein